MCLRTILILCIYGPHINRVNAALNVNYRHRQRPDIAARDKVIESQLNERIRVEQCQLQGIECEHHGIYLFSQMDSLLLPKVLELVGTRYSQSQFYRRLLQLCLPLRRSLKSSLLSTQLLARTSSSESRKGRHS